LAPGRCRFPDWQAACAALQGRDGQRPPDWWARAPRLAPLAAGGAAGALRVHLRAPGAPERGRLPAHGCARWRGGELPVVLRHSCGYKLANDGRDTRSIQHYLGHRSIASTVRYTALAPDQFKDFWKD